MTVSVCTPLLQIKQPGSLVFAVHFTVNQYLDRYMGENHIFQKLTTYYYSSQLKSGSSLAAAVCLTYLSLPVIAEIQTPHNFIESSELVSASNQEYLCSLMLLFFGLNI